MKADHLFLEEINAFGKNPTVGERFIWLKMSWPYPSSPFFCEWELKLITAILSSQMLFIFLSGPGRWKPTISGTVWIMAKQPTTCLKQSLKKL